MLRLEDFEPGSEGERAESVAADVLERLRTLGVSVVASELGPTFTRHVALDTSTMPRLSGDGCVAGVALTVANPPGSTASLLEAIGSAQPGDALVIVSDGQTATWGELTGQLATARGVAAVFVDGVARDVARLRDLNLSVWARRVYVGERPNSSIKGQVNVPVNMAGIRVSPGDVLLADDDGILCIPRNLLEQVLDRAEKRRAAEEEVLADARTGTVTNEWRAWGEGQQIAAVRAR